MSVTNEGYQTMKLPTETNLNPQERLCACHAQPVRSEHRRTPYGTYQPYDYCVVDGFGLGFGGGLPRECWHPEKLAAVRRRVAA